MDAAAAQKEMTDTPQSENTVEETAVSQPETIVTGFVTQDGNIYYYDTEGNLVTGWFDVNDHKYCAKNDGSLYRDGEHEIDNAHYLFGQDGICFGEIKDESWKQAYYDYIVNKASYQDGEYALCFVDDNEIPEIYIRQDIASMSEGTGYLITYKDNIVYAYEQTGSFAYIPRSGLSYTYGGMNGFYDGGIVRLNNAAWQQVAEFEEGIVDYYPGMDSDDYEYYYIFNGQEVTEEQYDENINTLFNPNQAVAWGSQMQTMNLSSMLAYLQN